VAQGRTDSPSPGSGSALTGTVIFVPPPVFLSPSVFSTGGTVTVPGPNGPVQVETPIANAILQVIERGAAGNQGPALTQAFGGGPQATALVEALARFGSERSSQSLAAAVRAYNAAVNAGPETPPAGLAAVRAFLANTIELP
jgi:hypothetical protein